MSNEELVLYRLDELKNGMTDLQTDIRAARGEMTAFREEHVRLEHRVDDLEKATVSSSKVSGGVTGGVAGAVVVLMTFVADWVRGRFGA